MAQEPKPEDRPSHLTEGGQHQQPHREGEQRGRGWTPTPQPQDAASDEIMAIRKAAGSIAEVIDNPNMQIQRVRIG